jgi:hypothetical protein
MSSVSADNATHGGEDRVPFAGAGLCYQTTNTAAGAGDEDNFLGIHAASPITTSSALELSSRFAKPNARHEPLPEAGA